MRISTGHIRKRKGALWEGQYVYQKQKRSIYGKNEEEVKKEMVKIMESIENNTYVRVDSYAADKRKTALYLGPVKTLKSRRTIFLSESVYQAFVEIKTLHEKYATQKEYNNAHDLVFCSSNGRAFDPKTYDDEFKKILSKANIREINIHATRHTSATEAMQKSNDIVTIADIMGHSKPSTTLDMYGHTFDDRKRALMEQFE